MRLNHVKEMLEQGGTTFGAWVSVDSPLTLRLTARAGFDWLLIDMEHSPIDFGLMTQMIGVIVDAHGPAPLVRVPSNSVENIKRVLDAGAWGVLVPMVNSAAEAEAIVAACKYPPQGTRSIGGAFAPLGFNTTRAEYLGVANEQILVGIQIESRAGLEQVEQILSVPGLDLAFIGPNDLHASLGLPPSNEGAEPEFVAAVQTIKAAAARHNVALGIFTSNGQAAHQRVQEGFGFISVTTDLAALLSGLALELANARREA